MNPKTIAGFDCLEFKWKVQSEIYEKTKNMSVKEQIAYFRNAAENGPFADLVRAIRAVSSRKKTGLASASAVRGKEQ